MPEPTPSPLPSLTWHLTARPWKPLSIPQSAYLDYVEGICRFTASRCLNSEGAVIDPFLNREHQYSTPYFAASVALLASARRAPDLLPAGIRAMDYATSRFARGRPGIPDSHGEFFIPSLAEALRQFEKTDAVEREKLDVWRERLKTPLMQVLAGFDVMDNNWRTYAMKGEWIRARMGLAGMSAARAFIGDSWTRGTQRERIAGDERSLYQDHSSDPEPHGVEAVGRGNLLALVAEGYDGPGANEIARLVEAGSAYALLLQAPDGQCPPNGRTDDHVWNDVLYQLIFEVMAGRELARGNLRLAGQYRRASLLAFQSIARWRRTDGDWKGSFFITKNRFDPRERVGYQTASNWGNYNGAVMLHLAEAYHARDSVGREILEQPAPAEIGGYAVASDPHFASVVANAGGMQMFANLRGDTALVYDHYWTSLGVSRFGRVGWDGRLGPGDGVRDGKSGRGVTFAPTWRENGQWVRLADVPDRYQGTFSVPFTHPLLVCCAIEYRPIQGMTGPAFRHEFTLTPDGVFARLHCLTPGVFFGVTWPLLENDGNPLQTKVTDRSAITGYRESGDQQCFLATQANARTEQEEISVQGTYGWLRPIRLTVPTLDATPIDTFIYPRSAGDPDAETVRLAFRTTEDGFTSPLGHVHGSLYSGRESAGGGGSAVDLIGGESGIRFDPPCRFLLQINQGRITAMETDRDVTAVRNGRHYGLKAHVPMALH